MTQPTTRTTFKDYCKRKLGHPVIELNLDDDQIEDTIDDAVTYWQEYHFDGTHPEFVKKQITASTQIVSSQSGTFSAGETIEGGTSGIRATINDYISSNTTIRYSKPTTKNLSNLIKKLYSEKETITLDSIEKNQELELALQCALHYSYGNMVLFILNVALI